MIRTLFIGVGCGMMLASGAGAQSLPASGPSTQATAATTSAAVSREAVEVLQMLEQRGETLRDFSGGLRYTAYKVRSAEEEVRTGVVKYLKEDGVTKFAILLDTFIPEGAPPKKIDQEIVFEGRWLITRIGGDKRIFRKEELAPPGEKANPLKLGEGPLPLPIGQKTEDIVRDFKVEVVPANVKLDPKTGGQPTVHLRLVPRDLKPRNNKPFGFVQADLWVDRQRELPLRVAREKPDGNVDTIDILQPQINTGKVIIKVPPTPAAGTGWDIAIVPYEGGEPGKPAGREPTTRP